MLVAYSVNIFQKKKKQIKHPSTETNINLRGSVWREKKKKGSEALINISRKNDAIDEEVFSWTNICLSCVSSHLLLKLVTELSFL